MRHFERPDWPAPARVRAIQTTRLGGVSPGVFASLNLGDHVGDDPRCVAENRDGVLSVAPGLKALWLQQVHGVAVLDVGAYFDQGREDPVQADAVLSRQVRQACVVMTADCLPVLFCDRAGTVVAAAHAGWRGLCDGVLENTLRHMQCAPSDVLAWLGPAIGPHAFEVGDEVRAAFVAHDPLAAQAFLPSVTPGKWLADLFELARQRLTAAGVQSIYGGGQCTYSQPERYFSYRRDGQTGRMASLIWLDV